MIIKNSRAAFVAVLPLPPATYDPAYFARIIDIINKAFEQFQHPREITLSRLVCTQLGDNEPIDSDTVGEVYTKDCPNCGATVLAINLPDS